MPLREDHDAALARADALEAELQRERAKDAEQDQRVAELEAELAAARDRLAKAEQQLRSIKPNKPKPPPAAASTTAAHASPDGGDTRRVAVVLIGLFAAIMTVMLGLRSCVDDSAKSVDSPSNGLKPPFIADRLLAEGLEKVGREYRVREISIEYVASDGTLDPEHGGLDIATTKPPPPRPPDDPTRPTGAPSGHDPVVDMMIASCPQPSWNPRTGWAPPTSYSGMGSCSMFGEMPVGVPKCTVSGVVARARRDGAPEGLARVTATWSFAAHPVDGDALQRRWVWKFDMHDEARGVSFSKQYEDSDCDPPPVEK